MPHKHTRRDVDEKEFNLPPTQFARPLPVKSNQQERKDNTANNKGKKGGNNAKGNPSAATTNSTNDDLKKRKRKAAGELNDTPRAFKRLMALKAGKKFRSGLDNGDEPEGKKKKNKKAQEGEDAATPKKKTAPAQQKSEALTIQPGERMSDFAARVDAALPVTGLIAKGVRGKHDPLSGKKWQTSKERKMHKMYDEWHEEDRKLKDKREEELELAEEEEEEEGGDKAQARKLEAQVNNFGPSSKKGKKKGKRAKYLGEASDPEDDPWEALRKARGEKRPGLHDVALAPPELNKKLPKKLMVRGAAVEVDGVPKAAGSLRRREELQIVRDDVVAQYRKLMTEKRAKHAKPE